MSVTTTTQDSGSPITVLASELNALASSSPSGASGTGTGTIFDNSEADGTPPTGGYLEAEVELTITFGSAPVAGSVATLYVLPSQDRSTFASPSPVTAEIVAVFPLDAVTTTQVVARRIGLYHARQKFFLAHNAGSTAGSGNLVKLTPTRIKSQ